MNNYDQIFVTEDWLQQHLDDPDVAILDVRAGFRPQPPGPSDFFSMRVNYEEAHIPNAHYLHMVEDLSKHDGDFPFEALVPQDLHQLLGSMGISNSQTLVIYGGDMHAVTHRCWWVLRQAGAQDVRLLNCTYDTWLNEGRPTTKQEPNKPPETFQATPLPHWIASKDTVSDAIGNPKIGLLNALTKEQFEGQGQHYGRPGRIPGSISVPYTAIVNPATGALKEPSELTQILQEAGANEFDQLITYCGGGIAASTAFLALDVLGYPNIALYDGSLMEWNQDPNAPLESGPAKLTKSANDS
jgi:thiosulfate/3-mercaptopyruvate sulfurtransferase